MAGVPGPTEVIVPTKPQTVDVRLTSESPASIVETRRGVLEEGPNRLELDAVIPDRPVILKDTSGHAQWLNTKALEVLGIDKNTPDPIPGLSYLYRDADGNPTGWILERAVDTQLKAAGIGDRISPDSLAAFLDSLAELGVTAVFDGGYSSGDYAYQAAAELERDGRMPLRYEGSYRVETADLLDGAAAELKRLREEFGGDRVKFNTIKVMFDGVSEIRTSAVLEPFLGEGGGRPRTLGDRTEVGGVPVGRRREAPLRT